jgi:hypothetical protein
MTAALTALVTEYLLPGPSTAPDAGLARRVGELGLGALDWLIPPATRRLYHQP